MQVTLYAPDVTCDHCIASIERAVGTVEGATFVSGDPDGKSFVVEVANGALLEAIATATEAEGYPLGEAPVEHDHSSPDDPNWVPAYRVTATEAGATSTTPAPAAATPDSRSTARRPTSTPRAAAAAHSSSCRRVELKVRCGPGSRAMRTASMSRR